MNQYDNYSMRDHFVYSELTGLALWCCPGEVQDLLSYVLQRAGIRDSQLPCCCYLRVNSLTCLSHCWAGVGKGHLSPAHAAVWQMRDGVRSPTFLTSGLAHLCSHPQSRLYYVELSFPCVVAGQGVSCLIISTSFLPLSSPQRYTGPETPTSPFP